MAKRAAVIKPVRPLTPAELDGWVEQGNTVLQRLPEGSVEMVVRVKWSELKHWLTEATGRIFGVLLVLLIAAPVYAQAPNRKDVVQAVSDADKARFACAHSGRACEADWIKAVAWALHQTDAAWGLNMKRDDDRQGISLDVVTYRLGPTDRHVQAFDICGSCGGSNPSVVWNEITDRNTLGQPGTARWVKPSPVAGGGSGNGGGGTLPAPLPPAPVPVNLQPVLDAIASLRAELTAKLDAIAGVSVEARDAAASAAHDAREVNGARLGGWPAVGGSAPLPCLRGNIRDPFGRNQTVTFCPVAQ